MRINISMPNFFAEDPEAEAAHEAHMQETRRIMVEEDMDAYMAMLPAEAKEPQFKQAALAGFHKVRHCSDDIPLELRIKSAKWLIDNECRGQNGLDPTEIRTQAGGLLWRRGWPE